MFWSFPELVPVISKTSIDNIECLVTVIDVRNLNFTRRFSGKLFVTEKVMPQAVDQTTRNVSNTLDFTKGKVCFEYCDDLIVRLLTINHAQPPNWSGIEKEAAVRKSLFC